MLKQIRYFLLDSQGSHSFSYFLNWLIWFPMNLVLNIIPHLLLF